MPTAIEYGLTNHWHTQNGAGGGPPAANLVQNGAGTGPPSHHDAAVLVPPALPTGELLFAGPLAALLLVVAVVAAVRHRARPVAAQGKPANPVPRCSRSWAPSSFRGSPGRPPG